LVLRRSARGFSARGIRNACRTGVAVKRTLATNNGISSETSPRMPTKLPSKSPENVRPGWDLARIFSLLKGSVEEIEKEQPFFFGTLKIEVNYREGDIETVIVNRRQTFKD
jgi:hypothetical protein